jgi:Transposase DDE domain
LTLSAQTRDSVEASCCLGEGLDKNPQAMRQRRETAEHPFGTLKMRMGATHFLMKRLPKVATEMALHVLAYNLTRVMNIMGIQPLMAAIRA